MSQEKLQVDVYAVTAGALDLPSLSKSLEALCGHRLWQNGAPLSLSWAADSTPQLAHSCGTLDSTEAISDEWFVVSVLLQLSVEYPALAFQVRDGDGELILIEAANDLPIWLEPETSQNRVFLHQGQVHIIPMALSADPSLSEALSLLGTSTVASKDIQSAIQARLDETSMPYLHHTLLSIPHSIAHLLFHDPHLVSYAVSAFYTRDPVSLKACQKMPSFKPTNYVPMRVQFTRTMYAQLTSQSFIPPSKEFPEIKNSEDDISVKLVCGFEMLVQDPYWTGILRGGTTEVKEWDFDRDAGWKTFENRLKALSYYHGEIEGSAKYRKLKKGAQEEYFTQYILPEIDAKQDMNPIARIRELQNLPLVPAERLPKGPSDDNGWLNVDPDTVEKEMQERYQGSSMANAMDEEEEDDMSDLDPEERKQLETLSKLVGGFNDFVHLEESGERGALFPGQKDVDEDEEQGHVETHQKDPEDGPIQLNSEKFFEVMMESLGIKETDLSTRAPSRSTHKPQLPEPSFKHQAPEPASLSEETQAELESSFEEYLRSMDAELSESTKLAHFTPDADKGDEKVQLNSRLVENILESFTAQQGLPGPASNIISSLGLTLPKRSKEEDMH